MYQIEKNQILVYLFMNSSEAYQLILMIWLKDNL